MPNFQFLIPILALLPAAIRMATPLALTAVGGTFSERSGVVNIALEGMMLQGAFACVVITFYTSNPYLGLFGAMLAGLLLALLHALTTITFKANQIVSGVALNLLAIGLTQFLSWVFFDNSANSEKIIGLPIWEIPILSSIPILRELFSGYSPIIYATIFIIFISDIILFHSIFGLRLRAVGEDPLTADTLGLPVQRIRYYGVLISGLLAGLGGAFLALETHYFVKNMTNGRGFIALAAMIFGKWSPWGVAGAALLFGFTEALQMTLQSAHIPTQFIQMLPYIITILVLVGAVGHSMPPKALGIPYKPNEF